MKAREAVLIRQHNERAWAVWHTAALSRAKKMPKLAKLLLRPRRTHKRRSWREQLAVVEAWHAKQALMQD